jgi:hypothetical protein
MTITNAELERIVELGKLATGLPWTRESATEAHPHPDWDKGILLCEHGILTAQLEANWDLAIASANTAPALAAELLAWWRIFGPALKTFVSLMEFCGTTQGRFSRNMSLAEARELLKAIGE